MSKHEFFHSTIRDVNIFLYAYQKRERENIKMMEYNAWLNGIYIRSAIASCFDKKHEYPENPLAKKDIKSIAVRTGKTEVEMNRELVMATLKIRQANAELNEKLGNKKTDSESDE